MSKYLRVSFVVFFLFSFFSSLSSQSPEPDTICAEADIFCNANDFRGPWTLPNIEMNPTPDYYICDQPTENTGRPQNILFFGFVPTSNYVEFDIIIKGMTPQAGKDTGYQYGVVDRCIEEEDVEYIVCDGSQVTAPVSKIQSSNFIPGHTYYLYIDGYTGCIVDFEIDLIAGLGGYNVDEISEFVAVDKVGDIIDIAKNDTVTLCSGGTFEFRSKNILNTDSYRWFYDGVLLSNQEDTSLSASFNPTGDIIKICHQGVTGCDSSDIACFYVKVDTLPVVHIDTTICESKLIWGYTPDGWECQPIKTETLVSCNSIDTITGCRFIIEANVHEGKEPIVSVDSVHCGSSEMKNDTMIRYKYQTQYGCDSIVDANHYYFSFDGEIDTLICNDGTFELNIVYGTDLSAYQNYEVVWYLDGVEISNSNSFVLGGVNNPGKYSATVKLYKNHLGKELDCSADIEEYEVSSIPSTLFALNADTICVYDSCILTLDSYDAIYDYKVDVSSSKAGVKDIGGGHYQINWSDFSGVDTVFVQLDGDCSPETRKVVYVMPEVIKPIITCKKQTNSSVEFEWETSDCVEEFDVWIDDAYMGTQSEKTYKVEGLAYGQTVKIQVETKSIDCVCGTKMSIDSCTALDCPEVSVSIDNLPDEICYSELDDVLKLEYSADTSGIANWVGTIIDSEGVISRENISSTEGGMFYVTLNFAVGDCDYNVVDSINIMPEVDASITIKDISCYDMTDGELLVEPLSGKDDFVLELNGEEQNSMLIENLDEGSYDIVLTDANGCQYSSSFDIVKPDAPQIVFEGEEIIEFNSENSYSIDFQDYDSIAWFKNDTFLDISSDHLEVSSNQGFKLCYTVFFDTLCEFSDCKLVRIDRDNEVFMPNIFSPNADGTNDYIFPVSKNGLSYHINTYSIFDRWGEMVYEKSDFYIGGEVSPNIGWNGTFRGKQVPQGVYVYYIEIINENGEITKKYGDITLVR